MQSDRTIGGSMTWQKKCLEENPQFSEQEKIIIRLGPHFYLPDEVIFYQEQKKIYTGD
tara:strand:+ start:852 stop:1025 length:174 start_codon:yes stop_codon:yes gene_type:complete